MNSNQQDALPFAFAPPRKNTARLWRGARRRVARGPGAVALAPLLMALLTMLMVASGVSSGLAQEASAPGQGNELPVSLEPAMGPRTGAPTTGKETAGTAAVSASPSAAPLPVPPPEDEVSKAPGTPERGHMITPRAAGASTMQAQGGAPPEAMPARNSPAPATPPQGTKEAPERPVGAQAAEPAKLEDRITPAEAATGTPRDPAPPVVDVLPHFLGAGLIAGGLVALLLILLAMATRHFSPRLVASFLFATGALAFTLAYAGVLSALWGLAQNRLLAVATLAEALMMLGAGVWLVAWLGMPESRWGRLLLMMLAGLVLSLVVLSAFYPVVLLPVVRVTFFAIVLGGLSALFWPGMERHRTAFTLLAMAGLFAWSMFGLLLTLRVLAITSPNAVLGISALVALLALLMGLATMTPEAAEGETKEDAALALAGADALPFRFEPATARLRVPRRLADELHLPAEVLDSIDGFLAIVHPDDRPLLEAALRTAGLDEPTALHLRLADAQGVWRHFTLRARAIEERPNAPRVIAGALLETEAHAVPQAALRGSEEVAPAPEPLHDPLTGLPGQALLLDRLETALARARRGEGMPCLVIADVDRFRAIIDAQGIAAADALVVELARRLAGLLHEGETLARVSGDQFAMVVDAERHGTPLSFVREIRQAVAEPFDLNGQELGVSLSIGVVDLVAAMALAPRELVRAAEIALFEARREGPGREAFFTPDMHGEHARLARLEQELRRALKMGELEVHYQPIIWLGGRWLAGFEALVRWRHPERGLIGPEEFIGLAEDIGLVRDIGHLVLQESVRQLAIWQRSFRTEQPFYVAVNVASTDLLDPTLADEVAQLLARENANPAGLRLEVTESLLLRDPAGARATLQRLAEMGVGVVCDDFGTGYSSLSRLRTLPFDALKIDRSFLSSDDPASRSVIGAIVGLAHGLSMHVVAEGVEESWQLALLEELACDMAQGYLIAPALDATTILHFMTEARRIAPFTGRLAALSHILLNPEVAPPLPESVGKPQLPPKRPPASPPRERTPRGGAAPKAPEPANDVVGEAGADVSSDETEEEVRHGTDARDDAPAVADADGETKEGHSNHTAAE